MLLDQLHFESLTQRRRPFVWFCIAAFFGIAFFDTVQTGWQGQGNLWINGAAVITTRAIIYSLLGAVAVAGIVTDPMVRDRATHTQEAILTTPVTRIRLGLSRFSIAFLIVVTATAMFIPGMILGTRVSGIPPELIGPFVWQHYAAAMGWFLVPNFFLLATFVFAVASRWESRTLAYGATVAAIGLWVTTRMLLGRDILRQEMFTTYALLDPFGSIASSEFAAGHTVAQNNEIFPPLAGTLLWNRLIWSMVALVFLFAGVVSVPMRPRPVRWGKRKRSTPARVGSLGTALGSIPGRGVAKTPAQFSSSYAWQSFWLILRWELTTLWRQPGTHLCLAFVTFTVWWSAASAVTHQFSLPSTDLLVHNTGYYFDKVLVLAIVWVAGELLWRDRSLNTHELLDAQPISDFVRYLARTATLLVVVVVFWITAIIVNIGYQATHGYYRFEPGLYLTDSFVFKAPYYFWLALLAIAVQAMVRHRYIGIALVLLVYVGEVLLDALHLYHPLFRFGRVSHFWYSLMDGYGHFWQAHRWLLLYWTLGAITVWLVGWAYIWRGVDLGTRSQDARQRLLTKTGALGMVGTLCAFVATGGYIW
ncbi:MAG: ABC transporter permease, partial [Planctomycetota bacterium]